MSSTARQSACARFWESPELVTHMMRGLPSLEQTVICRLNSRLFSIACKVVWSQPLKAGFFDWVFECLSNSTADHKRGYLSMIHKIEVPRQNDLFEMHQDFLACASELPNLRIICTAANDGHIDLSKKTVFFSASIRPKQDVQHAVDLARRQEGWLEDDELPQDYRFHRRLTLSDVRLAPGDLPVQNTLAWIEEGEKGAMVKGRTTTEVTSLNLRRMEVDGGTAKAILFCQRWKGRIQLRAFTDTTMEGFMTAIEAVGPELRHLELGGSTTNGTQRVLPLLGVVPAVRHLISSTQVESFVVTTLADHPRIIAEFLTSSRDRPALTCARTFKFTISLCFPPTWDSSLISRSRFGLIPLLDFLLPSHADAEGSFSLHITRRTRLEVGDEMEIYDWTRPMRKRVRDLRQWRADSGVLEGRWADVLAWLWGYEWQTDTY